MKQQRIPIIFSFGVPISLQRVGAFPSWSLTINLMSRKPHELFNQLRENMGRIAINDFIPPIVLRAIRYVNRSMYASKIKLPPFDQVPGDIDPKWILDVGANIGDVSLAALKTYPGCQVICFEPVGETFETLKNRVAPYKDRIKLFNQALSDSNGVGEINITSFHGANSIAKQSRTHSRLNPHVSEIGKEKISLVRLDDVAHQFEGCKIDIMKIDVEGHEYEVIQGGVNFIKDNVDTIIIEASLMRYESWERQSIVDIFSLLSEMGFRLINVFDLHYAPNSKLMCAQMDCVFRHKSKLI